MLSLFRMAQQTTIQPVAMHILAEFFIASSITLEVFEYLMFCIVSFFISNQQSLAMQDTSSKVSA